MTQENTDIVAEVEAGIRVYVKRLQDAAMASVASGNRMEYNRIARMQDKLASTVLDGVKARTAVTKMTPTALKIAEVKAEILA